MEIENFHKEFLFEWVLVKGWASAFIKGPIGLRGNN